MDNKKLSAHVRFTQFTLVTICVALLATTQIGTQRQLSIAIQQINEVIELKSNLSRAFVSPVDALRKRGCYYFPINEYVANHQMAHSALNSELLYALQGNKSNKLYKRAIVKITPRTWFFDPKEEVKDPGLKCNFTVLDLKEYWKRIGVLNSVWYLQRVLPFMQLFETENDHGTLSKLDIEDTIILIKYDNDWPPSNREHYYEIQFDRPLPKNITDRYFWSRPGIKQTHLLTGNFRAYSFGRPSGRKRIYAYIPAHYQLMPIDPIKILKSYISTDWQHRNFDKQFPELIKFSKNTQSLDLSDLGSFLADQKLIYGDQLSIMGVSVSSNNALAYGALVIALIQLYMLFHLKELARRLIPGDEAFEFPWLLFYKSSGAGILYHASVSLVPSAVSIYLLLLIMEINMELLGLSLTVLSVSSVIVVSAISIVESIKIRKVQQE